MLVVDTSAFVSLAVGNVLTVVVDEFEVGTTTAVLDELRETAEYDDPHGEAASRALELAPEIGVCDADERAEAFVTSRIDIGEASCVVAAHDVDAAFLVTDDFRALPERRKLVDANVALSPVVLRALVERAALDEEGAEAAFEAIAEGRDWLGAPIHRYARDRFE
mgnify:CR=1 FL=1